MPRTAATSPSAPAASGPAQRRRGLARLLVWNDRSDFVPSLRDERGASLTPGLFTGVRGARAQTAALAEARALAQRQGRALFAFAVDVILAGDASLAGDSAARASGHAGVPDDPDGESSPLISGCLDLARLTRSREAELLNLLGLPGLGKAGAQEGPDASRPRLASLAQASPAGFFPRLFAHPACAGLTLVHWQLPGGTRGVCAGRCGLPLATARPCQIANITLCVPATDLLDGLSGEARQARIRYLLGLPDEYAGHAAHGRPVPA